MTPSPQEELTAYRDLVAELIELHHRTHHDGGVGPYCGGCGCPWKCMTRQALDRVVWPEGGST